jgi:hypothetical protein
MLPPPTEQVLEQSPSAPESAGPPLQTDKRRRLIGPGIAEVPALLALLAVPALAVVALLSGVLGGAPARVAPEAIATRLTAPPGPPLPLGTARPTPAPAPQAAALQPVASARTVGLFSTAPDIQAGTPSPHGERGSCTMCHRVLPPAPGAAPAPAATIALALDPSSGEAPPAGLPLQSVRWAGLELLPLGPRVASALSAPAGSGVLLMSLSLRAGSCGLAAGDIITAVEGKPTPDLKSLVRAAEAVRGQPHASLQVLRRGAPLDFQLEGDASGLGPAMGRTAPPIAASSTPLHAPRGACAGCHPIQRGP